ncbi:MAG: AAA family ATPase [Anaerolineae bacterium]
MTVNKPQKLNRLGNNDSPQRGQSGPLRMPHEVDWYPPPISSLEDTGLTKLWLADLVLKIIYSGGDMTGSQVSKVVRLPFTGILDKILSFLKQEKLIEVVAGGGFNEAGFRYQITDLGANKAREALDRSQYADSAPVPVDQYIAAIKAQNVKRPPVRQQQLRGLMTNLVIADEMLTKVGPAVNSGRAIFLYGPPGNGKTTIAERVGEMILGRDMWIPYAVDVNGQVVQLYDQINHVLSEDPPEINLGTGMVADPRWVCIKRPMIVVGGELTMAGLDLVYDPVNKFYEAPFQMKAIGGMFLIDDFGRQQVSPVELLNRWIVPLETGVDFLTLNNGRKFSIPFFVMTIFSTNLDPKDLVDEAFLRRIRHKIEVGNPTIQQFREIFEIMCRIKNVPFSEDGLKYLIKEWYIKHDRDMRMVHPRDILSQMQDIAGYLDVPADMGNRELIDRAAASYFVEL